MAHIRPVAFLVFGIAAFPHTADAAQQDATAVPVRYTLTTIDTLPDDFTRIAGIRELSDGTLLVADAVEDVIKVLRPGADSAVQIGRVGQGPGEWYRHPGQLFAFFGDSTVVNDIPGARMLFIAGAEMTSQVQSLSSVSAVIGADTLGTGHWLIAHGNVTQSQPRSGRETQSVLTLLIVRYSRDLAAADTLAEIGGGSYTVRRDNRIRGGVDTPQEDALGFADGWIAFGLHQPYRVDWLTPDGEWVHGPPLRTESNVPDVDNLYSFRPMQTPALVRAADGRLLVRRTMAEGSSTVRYDVIDRSGRLNGFFMVNANEVVLDSGKESLYVSTEDSLGLLRIRRVQWPPAHSG